MTTDIERLEAHIARDGASGCWVWTGELQGRGYGRVFRGRHTKPRYALAHRFAYEVHVGPIPDGKVIDHLCRNRRCVNPAHLEPVTSRTNILRSPIAPGAINARKDACLRDHPFTEANTYLRRNRNGGTSRVCRTCQRAADRRSRLQRAAA